MRCTHMYAGVKATTIGCGTDTKPFAAAEQIPHLRIKVQRQSASSVACWGMSRHASGSAGNHHVRDCALGDVITLRSRKTAQESESEKNSGGYKERGQTEVAQVGG